MIRDRFWWTLIAIGVITLVSGVLQCVAPAMLWGMFSVELTLSSRYFMAVTGILTAAFGALMIHALVTPAPQHVAFLWTAIQKILTSAAIGLAIQDEAFPSSALGAAAFELISGMMIIAYWFWIKQKTNEQLQG